MGGEFNAEDDYTELVRIEKDQFNQLDKRLNALRGDLMSLKDRIAPLKKGESLSENVGKWLAQISTDIQEGFESVVEVISKLQPPGPPPAKMKGTIYMDYQIPANQPDAGFSLVVAATDDEGHPITDPAELAKLTVEVINSDDSVFAATIDPDDNRKGGYHVGGPGQATVTQNLMNADGELIGTGTDAFTVTTGPAKLGSVKSEFEALTPIV